MLNYHYLGQELGSTCFEVQRRLGNTMTLNSPWKTRQNTCRSENNVLKYSLWDGVFVCVQLPRCIQWQKLYSLLQHRLEAQGKWERNLSCKKQNKPQLIVTVHKTKHLPRSDVFTCNKSWEGPINPPSDEDHGKHVRDVALHHVCQHAGICGMLQSYSETHVC